VSPQTKMEPKFVVRDVEESLCETVAKLLVPVLALLFFYVSTF